MRTPASTIRHQPLPILIAFTLLLFSSIAGVGAQTQEHKPGVPGSPPAGTEVPGDELPTTGVSGSTWEGPSWGVRLTWDPAEWSVEDEFITEGYDGLQLGTDISTVYVEAYDGFDGDAETCLAEAEAQIAEREGVSDVTPVSGHPLPVPDDVRGEAELFGVTARLADGTVFHGIEYVECRTLVPGQAVLELTWQTVTGAFDEDFPNVEALFRALELPSGATADATAVSNRGTPTP
jgi:hypothetical protein